MSDKTLGAYERHETPDDMDGGVTAALIEKEADGRMLGLEFRARFLSDDRDYWKGRAEKAETKLGLVTATSVELEKQLDRTRDDLEHRLNLAVAASEHNAERAVKAEKERDEVAEDRDRVFDLVRDADMHRDLANERAERAERERDEARVVPDGMVERARQRGSELAGAVWDASVVEAMLTAALTEPQRPVGAEVVQNYLEGFLSGVRFLDDIDPAWLADCLIEALNINGVCVVTEDGGGDETPDVCPHIGGPGGDCKCPL